MDAPHSPPDFIIDENTDLYCLECSYNLRGLPGDPRICPECGHPNPIGQIAIPAGRISAELKRMETAPALCIASVLFGTPLAAVAPAAFQDGLGSATAGTICCFGIFPFLCLWFYIVNVSSFAASCRNKSGWVGVLYRYHQFAFLLLGTLLVLPFPVVYGLWKLRGAPSSVDVEVWFFSGETYGAILSALALHRFIGRAYARVKEQMEPMQREVALQRARERLDWELRQV